MFQHATRTTAVAGEVLGSRNSWDNHRYLRCRNPVSITTSVPRHRAGSVAWSVRHLARFDEREAVRWANRQMQRLDDAALWRALEEACQVVLPLAETGFGPENEWTTARHPASRC